MLKEAESDLKIVRLSENDVELYRSSLYELLQICICESFGTPAASEWINGKLDGLRSYLAEGKAVLLGALEQDALQGFLWGYETCDLQGRNFHVAYLAVLPAFRHRGAGAALMKKAEVCASEMGISRMELIVSAGNQSARRFYGRQAYQEARLIMKKDLTEKGTVC